MEEALAVETQEIENIETKGTARLYGEGEISATGEGEIASLAESGDPLQQVVTALDRQILLANSEKAEILRLAMSTRIALEERQEKGMVSPRLRSRTHHTLQDRSIEVAISDEAGRIETSGEEAEAALVKSASHSELEVGPGSGCGRNDYRKRGIMTEARIMRL